MRTVMPLTKPKTGMDMSFAMVSILHDDLSVTWLVPSDEAADEVIQAAFGDQAVRDGNVWRIEPYASRKAVFIPAITLPMCWKRIQRNSQLTDILLRPCIYTGAGT